MRSLWCDLVYAEFIITFYKYKKKIFSVLKLYFPFFLFSDLYIIIFHIVNLYIQ